MDLIMSNVFIKIIIFHHIMTEIGNGDLPSLRSREGPGVSMYETKEPNEVCPAKPTYRRELAEGNSPW
jgi:hypothetical protein